MSVYTAAVKSWKRKLKLQTAQRFMLAVMSMMHTLQAFSTLHAPLKVPTSMLCVKCVRKKRKHAEAHQGVEALVEDGRHVARQQLLLQHCYQRFPRRRVQVHGAPLVLLVQPPLQHRV